MLVNQIVGSITSSPRAVFAVFNTSFQCSLRPSCALGVKVGLRAAVFYGFPYKLRPKPKIAI